MSAEGLHVHSTDELFAALPAKDVRALLARTRADAAEKAVALRELVGDRYADLIDTADEAAALTTGVADLTQRVSALQRAAHALFSLGATDSLAADAARANAITTRNPPATPGALSAWLADAQIAMAKLSDESALWPACILYSSASAIITTLLPGGWRAASSGVTGAAKIGALVHARTIERSGRALRRSAGDLIRDALTAPLASHRRVGPPAASQADEADNECATVAGAVATLALLDCLDAGNGKQVTAGAFGSAVAAVVRRHLLSDSLRGELFSSSEENGPVPSTAVGHDSANAVALRLGSFARVVGLATRVAGVLGLPTGSGGSQASPCLSSLMAAQVGAALSSAAQAASAANSATLSATASAAGATALAALKASLPQPAWAAQLRAAMGDASGPAAPPHVFIAAGLLLPSVCDSLSAWRLVVPQPTESPQGAQAAVQRASTESEAAMAGLCEAGCAWVAQAASLAHSSVPALLDAAVSAEGASDDAGRHAQAPSSASLQAVIASVSSACAGAEGSPATGKGVASFSACVNRLRQANAPGAAALPELVAHASTAGASGLYTLLFGAPLSSHARRLVREALGVRVRVLANAARAAMAAAVLVGEDGAAEDVAEPGGDLDPVGPQDGSPDDSTGELPTFASLLQKQQQGDSATLHGCGPIIDLLAATPHASGGGSSVGGLDAAASASAAASALALASAFVSALDGEADGEDGSVDVDSEVRSRRHSAAIALLASATASTPSPLGGHGGTAAPSASPVGSALRTIASSLASAAHAAVDGFTADYAQHAHSSSDGGSDGNASAAVEHADSCLSGLLEAVVASAGAHAASSTAGLGPGTASLLGAHMLCALLPLAEARRGAPASLAAPMRKTAVVCAAAWATSLAEYASAPVTAGWGVELGWLRSAMQGSGGGGGEGADGTSPPGIGSASAGSRVWRTRHGNWACLEISPSGGGASIAAADGNGSAHPLQLPSGPGDHDDATSVGVSTLRGGATTLGGPGGFGGTTTLGDSETVQLWLPLAPSAHLSTALARASLQATRAGITASAVAGAAPGALSHHHHHHHHHDGAHAPSAAPAATALDEWGAPIAWAHQQHQPATAPTTAVTAVLSTAPAAPSSSSSQSAQQWAQPLCSLAQALLLDCLRTRLSTAYGGVADQLAGLRKASNSSGSDARKGTGGAAGWDDLGEPESNNDDDDEEEGGGVPDAPALQAALDTWLWGHLLPPASAATAPMLGAQASGSSASSTAAAAAAVSAGGPWAWAWEEVSPAAAAAAPSGGAKGGRASKPLCDLASSLLASSAGAFAPTSAAAPAPPHRLWPRLVAHVDPVDWALGEPHLGAFAVDALRAHCTAWGGALGHALLTPQPRVAGGRVLTQLHLPTPGDVAAAGGGPSWRLGEVVAASSAVSGRHGKAGGETPGTAAAGGGSLPAPLLSALSAGHLPYATALLTWPVPAPVVTADLDAGSLPLLPTRQPGLIARLPLLPIPVRAASAPGGGGAGSLLYGGATSRLGARLASSGLGDLGSPAGKRGGLSAAASAGGVDVGGAGGGASAGGFAAGLGALLNKEITLSGLASAGAGLMQTVQSAGAGVAAAAAAGSGAGAGTASGGGSGPGGAASALFGALRSTVMGSAGLGGGGSSAL